MATAEFHEVLPVDKERLFSTIIQYEHYPRFVEGCTAVDVKKNPDGTVRVVYQVDFMSKKLSYTLDHREDPKKGVVEWKLVESDFFKKNDGKWELKSAGKGKSDVRYLLDLEFKIPVPGFILNRLVKGSLPTLVKSFASQAKSAEAV